MDLWMGADVGSPAPERYLLPHPGPESVTGATPPSRCSIAAVDYKIPVILECHVGATVTHGSAIPDRCSAGVVHDEVAVQLHNRETGTAECVARPDRASAIVENQIAIELVDQPETATGRIERLVRIEPLVASQGPSTSGPRSARKIRLLVPELAWYVARQVPQRILVEEVC